MTMKLITLEDNFNKCNKCREKSRGNGNSHNNNNINIVIDTNSQGGASAARTPSTPSTIDGRRAEEQRSSIQKKAQEYQTENRELNQKIESLIKTIQQNNSEKRQTEVIREVKFVPTFIDRIKQIFVPVPDNRVVERVITKVEPVQSNRIIEHVRTHVQPVPDNRAIDRVRTHVAPVQDNRVIEHVRTEVKPVPDNRIFERIKKRFIIIRENQPKAPKSLT